MEKKKVVIAGGTGFVGRALCGQLEKKYSVTALSRSRKGDMGNTKVVPCDLFSLSQLEEVTVGASLAVYLVHSMQPTARLMQADFADIDLLLADNFARACKKNGVKQIVYLSGLIPEAEELSHHLESRLEVERLLGSHGVPVTSIRAGLIIGPGGSSFQILLNLVKRLPVMVLPEWTRSLTQPVALEDAVKAIEMVLEDKKSYNRHYDIGCAEPMTYAEMLERAAAALGRKLVTLTLPVNSYFLSKLWVRTFSGSSMALVSPLVESLKNDMTVARPILKNPVSFEKAITQAVTQSRKNSGAKSSPIRRQAFTGGNLVRSIQRFKLPAGRSARWASLRYAIWLSRSLKFLDVQFDRSSKVVVFSFAGLKMLELTLVDSRSDDERMVYRITDGLLLDKSGPQGRLEFRTVFNRSILMVAIHDFCPSLPWQVYTLTQAQVHLAVMNAFGRYLEK